MTNDIFAALEMRFNSFPLLVTAGRKLYQGFDEDREAIINVRPYTEVNIEKDSTNLSTWDADIDRWDLRFRYHAKDLRTISADAWLGLMRAAFKDAGSALNSHAFICCGTQEAAMSSPRNKDSAYDASIRFLMTLQRRVRSPMVGV